MTPSWWSREAPPTLHLRRNVRRDPRLDADPGCVAVGAVSIENLPGEEWRPVVGYEGIYEVSSLGRVKSLARTFAHPHGPKRIKARILKLILVKRGYYRVSLCGKGERQPSLVHQLVAEAFHGPKPTPAHEVCHNDGRPGNNAASNLRWDTHSENIRDTVRHGNHLWANRTHCPKNHPYTPENTYVNRGKRNCRECDRLKNARRRAEMRKLRAA